MQFRILWDRPEECPYLPNQTARMPLRAPLRPLTAADFDTLLEAGDRRSGQLLYQPQCRGCRACEPLRVPVARFTPTRSQRRVLRKNEGQVRMEVGLPLVTPERLQLYNRHKDERNLSRASSPFTAEIYTGWLVDSCTDTREVRYFVEDRLIAITILDFGQTSVSSVYHYFDPDESDRSLGVYSVLREIALCKELGLEWYYLGYYVRDCRHLSYKASYFPHQRRILGRWIEFAEGEGTPPAP